MNGRHVKVGTTAAERDLPFHVARHRRSDVSPGQPAWGPWSHRIGCKCASCR